jgi:hypothetical protein
MEHPTQSITQHEKIVCPGYTTLTLEGGAISVTIDTAILKSLKGSLHSFADAVSNSYYTILNDRWGPSNVDDRLRSGDMSEHGTYLQFLMKHGASVNLTSVELTKALGFRSVMKIGAVDTISLADSFAFHTQVLQDYDSQLTEKEKNTFKIIRPTALMRFHDTKNDISECILMPFVEGENARSVGIPDNLRNVFGYTQDDIDRYNMQQEMTGNYIIGIDNQEMAFFADLMNRRGLHLGSDVFAKNILVTAQNTCTLIDLIP